MRGKLIIMLAVLAGLSLGGLSVAYHHWLARRAIAWWGADNIELIAHAPHVEALKLMQGKGDAGPDALTISGTLYLVERRTDVADWPGIDHIRHGMLEDANFNWAEQPEITGARDWSYGLEFSDGPRRLIVVFDRDGHLGRSDQNDTLSIAPVATGWSEFFREQEREQGSGVGPR